MYIEHVCASQLVWCHQVSSSFLNATVKFNTMVHKPCPRCGKCCVCDLCLKPSGGRCTQSKDQPSGAISTSLLKRGRPKGSKHSNLSCAYCDESNSLANVICVGCEHPLKCKRGRPTENSDVESSAALHIDILVQNTLRDDMSIRSLYRYPRCKCTRTLYTTDPI